MAQVTEQNKELWIDLHTIDIAGSHKYDENLTCMYLQFFNKNDTQLYDQTKYVLRVALRALGYKIVKVETVFNKDDFSPVCISFYTNLPHNLHDKSTALYNDWIRDTHEERFVDA
jgi:hypothetical protein